MSKKKESGKKDKKAKRLARLVRTLVVSGTAIAAYRAWYNKNDYDEALNLKKKSELE